MAMPTGNWLKYPNKKAGKTIPNVILKPSLKNLPLIKFMDAFEIIIFLPFKKFKFKLLFCTVSIFLAFAVSLWHSF